MRLAVHRQDEEKVLRSWYTSLAWGKRLTGLIFRLGLRKEGCGFGIPVWLWESGLRGWYSALAIQKGLAGIVHQLGFEENACGLGIPAWLREKGLRVRLLLGEKSLE